MIVTSSINSVFTPRLNSFNFSQNRSPSIKSIGGAPSAFEDLEGKEIWNKLIESLQSGTEFQSVGNTPKTYKIVHVETNSFSFSGGDRKEVEDIDRFSFIDVINKLKTMEVFNTNSSKHHFEGTDIYAKRSPLFGLLLTKGIIEKL